MPDEQIHGPQILLRQVVKNKPGHWRTILGSVRDRDPFVLREVLHIQSEVGGISGTPGAAEAKTRTGKPVLLGYLASRLSIARCVAIVATSDFDEIPSTVIGLSSR